MTSAAVEPNELGTLIVVVGKAKNLVNKSRFGKQDPFCSLSYGETRQRTKPIKRGGQHPEWDEELRFAIVEDVDDVLVRSESQSDSLNSSLNGAPAPLPKDTPAGVITSAALANKSRKGPLNKKGGKSMKVACYADDAKEPELIGECVVNIDEVLKKGEVDEWYEFLYKDKYSGEVYLEMTFFSNGVPPVRRDVPRPPIHNYGATGGFNASPSGSLASAASRTRIAGNLTASGSVSGMSLYIPPYVQPGRAPSPGPSLHAQPRLPPSGSFHELGVPPVQRMGQDMPSTTYPTHPPYPSSHSTLPVHDSQSSIDALTRPMSAMSIGQSYASRPLAATPGPPPVSSNIGHAYGAHRHSVGGSIDAPWSSHLAQNQPAPAPTPHPRPMSSNDALPWEQIQRIEQERLQAGATPMPRPNSGQGYGAVGNQQYPQQSLAIQNHRIPSTIPESLRPAGPPQHEQHIPPRAQSFSSHSIRPPMTAAYPNLPPTPTPAQPLPPHSAPPINPSTSHHYQVPASSFGTLTQPVVDLHRAASPGPSHYPLQPNGSYQDVNAPQHSYHTPTRDNTYPPRPVEYQQTPPPTQTYSPAYDNSSQQPYQATPPPQQSGYAYGQSTQSPPRQPSVASSNDNGYVPWYQQTQSNMQLRHTPPPQSQSAYGQQNGVQYEQQPSVGEIPPSMSQYPQPLPPVPQSRPQPPAPRRRSVGYYPSDELYAQQRQESQTPQPPPWQQGHQPRQSYDQNGYDVQRQNAFSPLHSTSYSPHPPQQPSYQAIATPSPPNQQNWQQPQQYSAPQPPPTPHNATGYYLQQGPPSNQYQPPPQNDYRATSPRPSTHDYNRTSSPQPYGQGGSQVGFNGRSPSPQPPVQSHQPQQDPWQNRSQVPPPPIPSNQLIPPTSTSQDPNRSTSPSQSVNGNGNGVRTDWRSYMNSLASTGSGGGVMPARTPSPQPPPKDSRGQQQQWYTPPPSLPSSIAPPEGWRSTLPAQTDGHAWRG
ncbi:uncharacterized protein IL334_005575 [Kwoniella shivajii]|uniref:C2 domain-containing protein n=1 Tax=Kwoniella shivajii TaxID=564305 RepID=A0ABZ1D4T3_9TREE|nr:hypothetical protein IL334_005575 [Kwoniella shivajii]